MLLPFAARPSRPGSVLTFRSHTIASGTSCRSSPRRPLYVARPSLRGSYRASQLGQQPKRPGPLQVSKATKPDWVRELEEDAENDFEIAEILKDTDGDPDLINKKMAAQLQQTQMDILGIGPTSGTDQQMMVKFREVDPFDLWIWFELHRIPSEREKQLLGQVLTSWFMLGRLGAFNGASLQVYHKVGEDLNYLDYEEDDLESLEPACFHDMSNLESNGRWCRCWVNMGTADELGFDMLINSLATFSRENLGIRTLYMGGNNEDWEIPRRPDQRPSMNPMSMSDDAMDDMEY